MVNGQRGWALNEALVNAQKPERRKAKRKGTAGLEEDRDRAGEDGKQQQQHQQHGDGKALREQREPAKEPFAEDGEKQALQSQNEGRGKESAAGYGEQMAGEEARQVRRVNSGRKNQHGENICIEQNAEDEDGDGGHAPERPWSRQSARSAGYRDRAGRERTDPTQRPWRCP